MSVDHAVSAEWEQRDRVWEADLIPRDKMIVLAFIEFDRRGLGVELFPSLEHIAWMTGYAYSTVRDAVAALSGRTILARGADHVASPYAPRGRVLRYHFRPEQLPTRPSWADRCRQSAPVGLCISCENPVDDLSKTSRQVPIEPRQVPIEPRQVPAVGSDRTYRSAVDRTDPEEEASLRAASSSTEASTDPDHAGESSPLVTSLQDIQAGLAMLRTTRATIDALPATRRRRAR